MKQGTQTWYSGTTQKDGVGKEVEGGSGWWDTCTSMHDSWQTDGETMETVTDFVFLGSKITADGDCSDEIKRCLLLGRKVMTDLDSILKSRDITL